MEPLTTNRELNIGGHAEYTVGIHPYSFAISASNSKQLNFE